VLVSALVGAGAASVAWAWSGSPGAAGLVAGAVAVGVTTCLLVGSARRWPAATRLGRLRHPVVCWSALGALGLLTIVGSGAAYTAEDAASIDRNMAGLRFAGPELALRPTATRIVTDRGTTLEIMAVMSHDEAYAPRGGEGGPESRGATDAATPQHRYNGLANCYGWVFTGGRLWLDDWMVDQILADNGYKPVTTPRPGDVVVYRHEGTVTHAGIVRTADPGQPVVVEGKFGAGDVLLHQVDQSVYGTDFTYYRSPRPGHLITVIDGADSTETASTAP
jgi:hypothetical protein